MYICVLYNINIYFYYIFLNLKNNIWLKKNMQDKIIKIFRITLEDQDYIIAHFKGNIKILKIDETVSIIQKIEIKYPIRLFYCNSKSNSFISIFDGENFLKTKTIKEFTEKLETIKVDEKINTYKKICDVFYLNEDECFILERKEEEKNILILKHLKSEESKVVHEFKSTKFYNFESKDDAITFFFATKEKNEMIVYSVDLSSYLVTKIASIDPKAKSMSFNPICYTIGTNKIYLKQENENVISKSYHSKIVRHVKSFEDVIFSISKSKIVETYLCNFYNKTILEDLRVDLSRFYSFFDDRFAIFCGNSSKIDDFVVFDRRLGKILKNK